MQHKKQRHGGETPGPRPPIVRKERVLEFAMSGVQTRESVVGVKKKLRTLGPRWRRPFCPDATLITQRQGGIGEERKMEKTDDVK